MRAFIVATCLAVCASPALAQDYRLQTAAAGELQQMCGADAGQLWGASLCGPLLVVDANTRQVWATQRDNLNALTLSAGGGWAGTLPQGVPVANTTVDWGGVRWIMVVGPLPDDATTRRVLVAHESWHRVQASIGLPMQNAIAEHLETERGRYLLRLEMRALSTAMLSSGRARRNAVKDAIAFRMARLATFQEASAAEGALDGPGHGGFWPAPAVRLADMGRLCRGAARLRIELDAHRHPRRPSGHGGLPQHPRLALAAQADYALDCGHSCIPCYLAVGGR